MAEYCLKIGRIPSKSEWLAAMHLSVLVLNIAVQVGLHKFQLSPVQSVLNADARLISQFLNYLTSRFWSINFTGFLSQLAVSWEFLPWPLSWNWVLVAAASTLVHAFVVSRLDYCSAIYEGLPTCLLKCLGRVLRTAARLVGRIPRFSRVSGYMQMSFTGSPTHSALSTASQHWLGIA